VAIGYRVVKPARRRHLAGGGAIAYRIAAARVSVLFGLSAVIATGQVNVALVLVAMFLIGTAETFADSAGNTLLPMLVESKDIGLANARVTFGRRALNDLIGPPLGAGLFVIGLAAPFVMQGLLVALAAVMVSRIQVGRPADIKPTKGVRADVAEGMRWLWGNPPMRTLMLTIFLFNLTFGAAWPMLVLYADQQLGLDELGFGFLLSASAVGGLLGAAGFGWLERRFSLGMLMRVALLYETVFHLGLALSSVPVVSAGLLFLFGIEMSVWGTIANTIRQRSVPEHLLGRVSSVYLLGLFGGIVVGNALGAVIAGLWGVLAPFWFAFVGSAAMLIIIWRELPQVAYAEELGRQLR